MFAIELENQTVVDYIVNKMSLHSKRDKWLTSLKDNDYENIAIVRAAFDNGSTAKNMGVTPALSNALKQTLSPPSVGM